MKMADIAAPYIIALRVGEVFRSSEIADRAGVSQKKVGEALLALSRDGIVSRHGRWHWVRLDRAAQSQSASRPIIWDMPDVDANGSIVDRALASRPLLVVAFDTAVAGGTL
jgi:DNA-binding FadR family transcriptional regulator